MDEKINPQKDNEVPREITNLENGLVRLQEVVGKLSAKLSPALRPANPSPSPDKVGGTPERNNTPLSKILASYGNKVYLVVEEIENMVDRLEL